jgi:hypothetical protein
MRMDDIGVLYQCTNMPARSRGDLERYALGDECGEVRAIESAGRTQHGHVVARRKVLGEHRDVCTDTSGARVQRDQ